MNKVEFNKYINDLSYIQSSPNTIELRELCLKYPFFQTAHLLMSVAQNQEDSIFTGDYLAKTAIYSGDRTKLYQWVHKQFKTSETTLPEKEIQVSTGYNLEDIYKPSQKTTVPGNENKQQLARTLIDKFLAEKPSIQKPKAEFYSAPQKASESLEEADGFATETLAKIYIRQKNYSKAIKIYQELSLSDSKKSDYFAGLIESLKNKIND